MIDFFGQNCFYVNYKEEINKIMEDVLSKDSLLRGKTVVDLENKLKDYVNRKYVITVNSGTDAILIALKALGVKENDKILVPAFSFVASATPIKMLGAIPVFVDVEKETGLIDLNDLKNKIDQSIKGLIVVDLFGECPDYDQIIKLCKENNIFLLEDGAQSFDSCYNGKKAGTFGNVSTVSFDVSKTIFGVTTGGAILTDDEVVYNNAIKLRGHGLNLDTRDFDVLGYNSNMSSLNAALINYRIGLSEFFLKKRKEVESFYNEFLSNNKHIKLLKKNSFSSGNNHKYVIFTEERDSLMNFLKEKNIPTKIHYNKPIPYYTIFNCSEKFINAEYLSNHIMSLPIHPFLTKEDLFYIVDSIKEYYEQKDINSRN